MSAPGPVLASDGSMCYRLFAPILALCAAAGVAAFAASCGDDGSTTVDSYRQLSKSVTPAASASASGTAAASGTTTQFGPAPKLGGNVIKVQPAHAERIAQPLTRAATPDQPKGLCFEASFSGLDGNIQWFRLVLDGQEVTPKLTWAVSSATNPTGGRACYPLKDGIPVGVHTAAVSVQNPNNPNEPPRQLVGWGFEVTP